jgi:hypothetical protein
MTMGHTTGHKSVDFAAIMSDRDERPYPSAATIKRASAILASSKGYYATDSAMAQTIAAILARPAHSLEPS